MSAKKTENTVVVRKVVRRKMNFAERTYIPEFAKGLAVTMRQFFKNSQPNVEKRDTFTRMYPEEKTVYPDRYRGHHRLMLRDDGQVRCVACMCCSTVCPANCIHITAAEHDDISIEKYPSVFVIDELRCIMCGLCVDACPCDAIRMDSGEHIQPFGERGEAFLNRDLLMSKGSLSMAVQGGENG